MQARKHTEVRQDPASHAASPRVGGIFLGPLLVLLGALFATACGGEGADEATAEAEIAGDRLPPQEGKAATPPSRDSLTRNDLGTAIERDQIELLLAWTEGPTDRGGSEGAAPVPLRGLDSLTKDGFDRVTFHFPGPAPMPGYSIEFAEGAVEACDSGEEIALEHGARLVVRFRNSRARTQEGTPTVDLSGDFRERRNLKDIHLVCDSDGVLELALDLGGKRAYRIMEVREPRRLVLDIRNTVAP